MKKTVVLYPFAGVGHITPMVQLAKCFLRRGFAVCIAVMRPPINLLATEDAVARLAEANPDVTFHMLPAVEAAAAEENRFKLMLETIRLTTPHLADYLRSVSAAAVVFDMFCEDAALDAAAEVGIPGYYFFASGASVLAVFLHIAHEGAGDQIRLPGLPAIRRSDIPTNTMPEITQLRMHAMKRSAQEAKGMLVNTFEWLEAGAAKLLRNGGCVPGKEMPPVHCIGPLVDAGSKGSDGERHGCLKWLDVQPERSVVFLCFGSMGSFSPAQLEKMAEGLEKSGQRFLWVVRSPPADGAGPLGPRPEPDLEALLPEGFLERTDGVGMVVKSWAPQAAVLQHAAVGAFVTHCGWNSTLEAVSAGMPMVCWPLYAEQRLNKTFIVEGMRLGVEMRGYDEEIVPAEEVEAKVRWIMESGEAQEELRRRAQEAKKRAAEAVEDGGASRAAFDDFVGDLLAMASY